MLFLISYDLRTPGQDYPALTEALKKVGGVKVLLSAWMLASSSTQREVYDYVNAKLDTNDRLLVTEITKNSVWRNLLADKAVLDKLFESARA